MSVALAVVSAAVAVSVPAAAAQPSPAALPPVKTPLDSTPSGKALPKPPAQRQGVVPGQVLVTLDPTTSVTAADTTASATDIRANRLPDG
jgi:hypothetical protein